MIECDHTASARERKIGLCLLGAILLLGAGLRVWNLPSQSVCYDEYLGANYVDRATLSACLADQRVENRAMVPLYYTLQYFWAQTFGQSPVSLRILSLIFGLASIPLFYRLLREGLPRGPSLFAVLLFAISPLQVFHAQEIHPYSMVVLLTLSSLFTLVLWIKTWNRRWGAANIILNILLMWTHLFAFPVLFIEGILLLALRRHQWRKILVWSMVHEVLLLPVAWWVSTIRPDPNLNGAEPALALFGLFHAWRPYGQELYTLYALMTMSALLGLLIFLPKSLLLRTTIATIVVAIFGCNAVSGAMLPSRTQYLAAAKVIAKESASDDTIILNSALQERVFSYNTRWVARADKWPVIRSPENLPGLLTLVESLLDESSTVWICHIEETVPDPFPRRLERFLDARGVSFTRQSWQGMQTSFLYRCSKTPEHLPLTDAAAIERFRALNQGPLSDTSFLKQWLADALVTLDRPELAIAELKQVCTTAAPGDSGPRVKLAEALLANGNTEEGLAEYRTVLANSPGDFVTRLKYASALLNIERKGEALAEFSKAHESARNTQTALEFGQTLILLGRSSKAIPVLEQAIRNIPTDAVLYPVLAMALEAVGNPREALKQYEKAVELRPTDRVAHENLGHALLRLEQYERAVTELRTAMEIDPTITENRYWLCKVLLKQGDHEAADRELRKAIEINPRDVRVRIALIESLCEQGRKEEAHAILEAARQADLRLPSPPPGCME